ncbi:MAG: antitoxin [Spirochaetia bacterium]|jgi:plasmid stability protein
MATLQVRDIDDRVYRELKQRAKSKHRSLSQEVAHIIEEYLSQPNKDYRKQSEMLLELSGSWEGPESAAEIIESIKRSRVISKRFRKDNALFD